MRKNQVATLSESESQNPIAFSSSVLKQQARPHSSNQFASNSSPSTAATRMRSSVKKKNGQIEVRPIGSK